MQNEILRNIINGISLGVEILVICFLFHKVENKTENKTAWIGYAFLLLLGAFYFAPFSLSQNSSDISFQNFAEQIIRTVAHGAIVCAFLVFVKEKSSTVKIYLAAFYTTLYLSIQNIRILLVLVCMFYGAIWNYQFWFRILVIPMEILLVALVIRFVHFEKITQTGITRWFVVYLSVFLQLYIKWSLLTTQTVINETRRWESSVLYSSCAILGIVVLLILFEVNLFNRAEKSRLEMEQIRSDYELQNAKRAMQTNEEIRQLYHDMKNHLTAIRSIDKQSEAVDQYVDALLEQFGNYETNAYSGNSIVDSILAEKIQRARRETIEFNICLNLEHTEFINAADLVTMFGNAIDNAIEAAMKLPEEVERIIYIKSTTYANYLAIRFSNQFAGELTQEEGKIRTSKEDAAMHGIGLSSIRRSAQKYGGNVEITLDNEEHWFRLMVMIPMQ